MVIDYEIPELPGEYAEFELLPDDTLKLTRWPRAAVKAIVPEACEGYTVTEIATLAFAPFHIDDDVFEENFRGQLNISMMAMRLFKKVRREERDADGPTEIHFPASIRRIGAYAFWHCRNLKSITIPDAVEELPAGVFGECSFIKEIHLPKNLRSVGVQPKLTDQIMPDIGTFYCCHELGEIAFPAGIQSVGAYAFNSCGIRRLSVVQPKEPVAVNVHRTAFDHAVALMWMDKVNENGEILSRIGLPPKRDTILLSDSHFGQLLRIPVDFFNKDATWFDALAQNVFRVDFSARMALGRIQYGQGLSAENRAWYMNTLVNYFHQAVLIMQNKDTAFADLFAFLEAQEDLTADMVSRLIYTAGEMYLPAELISHMIEVRTNRFETVTGMEDLELDF